MPIYLHEQELATRWRMGAGTLAKWRVRRKGPAYIKIGGRVLYPLEKVEMFERQSLRSCDTAAEMAEAANA